MTWKFIDLVLTMLICLWLVTSCVKWPVCYEMDGQKHCISIYDNTKSERK